MGNKGKGVVQFGWVIKGQKCKGGMNCVVIWGVPFSFLSLSLLSYACDDN